MDRFSSSRLSGRGCARAGAVQMELRALPHAMQSMYEALIATAAACRPLYRIAAPCRWHALFHLGLPPARPRAWHVDLLGALNKWKLGVPSARPMHRKFSSCMAVPSMPCLAATPSQVAKETGSFSGSGTASISWIFFRLVYFLSGSFVRPPDGVAS